MGEYAELAWESGLDEPEDTTEDWVYEYDEESLV